MAKGDSILHKPDETIHSASVKVDSTTEPLLSGMMAEERRTQILDRKSVV